MRLHQRVQRQMDAQAQQLDRLAWGLTRSASPVRQQRLQLHDLALRLQQMRRAGSIGHLQHLRDLHTRLLQAAMRHAESGRPLLRLHQAEQALRETARQNLERRRIALDDWQHRWQTACRTQINHQAQRLARCADSMRLLHPQRVLERGFSLLQDETGHVLSQRADFHAGQRIVATVRDGQVPLTPRPKDDRLER
jgi:exodeoxyribonuclease VII large subunit